MIFKNQYDAPVLTIGPDAEKVARNKRRLQNALSMRVSNPYEFLGKILHTIGAKSQESKLAEQRKAAEDSKTKALKWGMDTITKGMPGLGDETGVLVDTPGIKPYSREALAAAMGAFPSLSGDFLRNATALRSFGREEKDPLEIYRQKKLIDQEFMPKATDPLEEYRQKKVIDKEFAPKVSDPLELYRQKKLIDKEHAPKVADPLEQYRQRKVIDREFAPEVADPLELYRQKKLIDKEHAPKVANPLEMYRQKKVIDQEFRPKETVEQWDEPVQHRSGVWYQQNKQTGAIKVLPKFSASAAPRDPIDDYRQKKLIDQELAPKATDPLEIYRQKKVIDKEFAPEVTLRDPLEMYRQKKVIDQEFRPKVSDPLEAYRQKKVIDQEFAPKVADPLEIYRQKKLIDKEHAPKVTLRDPIADYRQKKAIDQEFAPKVTSRDPIADYREKKLIDKELAPEAADPLEQYRQRKVIDQEFRPKVSDPLELYRQKKLIDKEHAPKVALRDPVDDYRQKRLIDQELAPEVSDPLEIYRQKKLIDQELAPKETVDQWNEPVQHKSGVWYQQNKQTGKIKVLPKFSASAVSRDPIADYREKKVIDQEFAAKPASDGWSDPTMHDSGVWYQQNKQTGKISILRGMSGTKEAPEGRYGTVETDENGKRFQVGPKGKRHYIDAVADKPTQQETPGFDGTGMTAQSWNTLLDPEADTRFKAAAMVHLMQSKVDPQTGMEIPGVSRDTIRSVMAGKEGIPQQQAPTEQIPLQDQPEPRYTPPAPQETELVEPKLAEGENIWDSGIKLTPQMAVRIPQAKIDMAGKAVTMTNAEKLMRDVELEGLNVKDNIVNFKGWFGIGIPGSNMLTSEPYQRFTSASEEWLDTWLRISTGATATADEKESGRRIFIPSFGDSIEAVLQKREQRKAFMDRTWKQAGLAALEHEKPWYLSPEEQANDAEIQRVLAESKTAAAPVAETEQPEQVTPESLLAEYSQDEIAEAIAELSPKERASLSDFFPPSQAEAAIPPNPEELRVTPPAPEQLPIPPQQPEPSLPPSQLADGELSQIWQDLKQNPGQYSTNEQLDIFAEIKRRGLLK